MGCRSCHYTRLEDQSCTRWKYSVLLHAHCPGCFYCFKNVPWIENLRNSPSCRLHRSCILRNASYFVLETIYSHSTLDTLDHGVGFGYRSCTRSISAKMSSLRWTRAASRISRSCHNFVAPITTLVTSGRFSTKPASIVTKWKLIFWCTIQ